MPETPISNKYCRWYHTGLDIDDRLGRPWHPRVRLRCSCGLVYDSIRQIMKDRSLIRMDFPLNGYSVGVTYRDIIRMAADSHYPIKF